MRSGTTRLDHGLGGGEHRVSSCGEAGCSVHRVAYDDAAPMKQIAAMPRRQQFKLDALNNCRSFSEMLSGERAMGSAQEPHEVRCRQGLSVAAAAVVGD